jgi:hypothetical protein
MWKSNSGKTGVNGSLNHSFVSFFHFFSHFSKTIPVLISSFENLGLDHHSGRRTINIFPHCEKDSECFFADPGVPEGLVRGSTILPGKYPTPEFHFWHTLFGHISPKIQQKLVCRVNKFGGTIKWDFWAKSSYTSALKKASDPSLWVEEAEGGRPGINLIRDRDVVERLAGLADEVI